jgi:hypothetical protein
MCEQTPHLERLHRLRQPAAHALARGRQRRQLPRQISPREELQTGGRAPALAAADLHHGRTCTLAAACRCSERPRALVRQLLAWVLI